MAEFIVQGPFEVPRTDGYLGSKNELKRPCALNLG